MIDYLLAPFEYGFMLRAFIVVIVSATLCGLISCWVVLLGWSMLGEAISHAIFPGVVLSFLLGVPFAIGAFVSGLVAVYLIGHLRSNPRIKEDAAMGVVFITMFSLGLILVFFIPGKGHLMHILFGNLLSVTYLDLYQVIILGVLGISILTYRRRDFTLYAFDPGHANVIGISTRSLHNIFLITLAFTIVVSVQQVGVVLVVAMLVIPGV
ncbi:metal ABC transporter permease, partial [Tropheryma whipplei]